jgi:hypothetical protein
MKETIFWRVLFPFGEKRFLAHLRDPRSLGTSGAPGGGQDTPVQA